MYDRMVVKKIIRGDSVRGFITEADLQIQSVDRGLAGSVPVVEIGDKYKTLYLAELLEKELDGENSSFDTILFGKVRLTIEKLGG